MNLGLFFLPSDEMSLDLIIYNICIICKLSAEPSQRDLQKFADAHCPSLLA